MPLNPVIHLKVRAKINGHPLFIREQAFYDGLKDFMKDNRDAVEFFNNKTMNIKQYNKITYRTINHWGTKGIIKDHREKNQQWRKFSIIDQIWLSIVQELRAFGVSLDKILSLKKHLLDELIDEVPILEYYLCLVYKNSYPIYLLVFNDGYCEIATDKQIAETKFQNGLNENFISINLNKYIAILLNDKNLKPIFCNYIELQEREIKVINILRNSKYKFVEIKLLNGKIERIEAKEQIENQVRIIDLVKDKKYQEIKIQTEKGKVIYIERKEKILL